MQYEHSNYYLAHHGVIGMKWGVRRYQKYNGELTSLGKQMQDAKKSGDELSYKEAKTNFERGMRDAKLKSLSTKMSEDAAQARVTKNAKDLSTKELDKSLNRLKKEQQYDEITHKGRTEAKKILKGAAITAGGALITGAALYGINEILKKKGLKLPQPGLLKI